MSSLLLLLPLEIWVKIANCHLSFSDYKSLWYVLPQIRIENRHPFAERISQLVSPEMVTCRLLRKNLRDRRIDKNILKNEVSPLDRKNFQKDRL
jgi:hypothetical protein